MSLHAKNYDLKISDKGASFDLETGWDALSREGEKEICKRPEQDDPCFCLIEPECKPFSQIMESNWSRMNQGEAQKIKEEGMTMKPTGVKIAMQRIRKGRKFALELPAFASSWTTHIMQLLMQQPGVVTLNRTCVQLACSFIRMAEQGSALGGSPMIRFSQTKCLNFNAIRGTLTIPSRMGLQRRQGSIPRSFARRYSGR